ncbi:MAG: hypothetical protein ACLQGP_18240 [Isosphaeraceae bacterium]
MGEHPRRLTLGRMMAVVGVVALILAMRRVDSAPAVSVCVFAACTWYLASRRFAEALARRTARGLETTRAQRVRILAGAGCLSVVAIGLPDGAFLAGYYGYMEAVRATTIPVVRNWSPDYEPWHMAMGAVIGIISALYVASIVRRWIGPIIGAKSPVKAAARREPIRSLSQHEHVSTRG